MTTTTIVIKRNADKNYDRLFAKVEAATIFGRAESLAEVEEAGGYAVTFKSLDADVIAWAEGKSRDFEIRYDG